MPLSKLPVLMYHKVTDTGPVDYLTVHAGHLEQQLQYLQSEGYATIGMDQLLNYQFGQQPLPPKPVLLTFDDGYADNFTLLYPLLLKYGMKATIFLVPAFLQQTAGDADYLSEEQLRGMDPAHVSFGYHTWEHKSYKEMTAAQMAEDIDRCKAYFSRLSLPMQPVLAYTYGAYPKKGEAHDVLMKVLQKKDIRLAFRIGNRLNALPLRRPLVVQRIDIRGDQSFRRFKQKLRWGGKWL